MKFRTLSLAIAGAVAFAAPTAFAQDSTVDGHKRVSVAAGYNVVKPKSDAFGDSRGLKGGSAASLSAAYHITDNIAIEAWAADKSEHKVVGQGVAGSVKAQPYALSGQYHFGQTGQAIRPYVGLGYYQAEFKDERDANGQPFGMTHAKGAMGTVGANFNITERWFTRAEARYMKGDSDVTRGGQKVGEATVDPWTVGVGVGARF